ncbi:YdeI/OmpD-associated family protein [Fontivita pretiosa]|uniref:YdeI/OmpD-associated family protein n=1 Tax=Fontivita pretiosa TaxID=2989684 RepID=UPI003D1781F1
MSISNHEGKAMGTRSPEVDAYIRNAPPFAQPILTRIRELFHRACPDVQEKLKWRVPSFEYKGMLGGMAAFKRHATWGLWKASLLKDPKGVLEGRASSPMAAGKCSDVSQLPPEQDMVDLIRQAVELNERGVKLPQRSRTASRPPPKTPPDLAAALKRNARAAATFKGFSPSHKREYIEWITEARQEQTRRRRVAQAIEWISQGRPRNWKYMTRK